LYPQHFGEKPYSFGSSLKTAPDLISEENCEVTLIMYASRLLFIVDMTLFQSHFQTLIGN